MLGIDLATADAVLATIALSMLLASAGAFVLPVSVWSALGLGSVPAGGSVGYALFYDPPVETGQ
jgi:hypothetical protein